MKNRIFLIVIAAALAFAGFQPLKPLNAPEAPSPSGADGVDVIEEAKAFNSPNAPAPPDKFRPGHVNLVQAPFKPEQTSYGFVIKMPSNTQIPSPTFYNNRLYVGGGFGSKSFYCVDPKTGQPVWSADLDDDGPSAAVADQDIVVFNTESCTIFACEASSGKMLWSHWMGDPLMSMPAIINGRVYTAYPAYGAAAYSPSIQYPDTKGDSASQAAINIRKSYKPSHVFACLDLKTGKILWQKWIDGDVMSAPVGVDDEVCIVSFPGTFYRFDQKTGEILEAKAARATSAPVFAGKEVLYSQRSDMDGKAGEKLVVKSGNSTIDLVNKPAPYLNKDVQDRSEVKSKSMEMDAGNGFSGGAPSSSGWQKASDNIGQSNVSSLQSFQGSRMLRYNEHNYSCMGDEVICTSKDGKEQWKVKLDGDLKKAGGYLGTPPLAAGGFIIVGTLQGEVMLLDPGTGKKAGSWGVGGPVRSQPVVHDGWIYVTTADGRVHGINTKRKELTGWPVWGGDMAHSGHPVQ